MNCSSTLTLMVICCLIPYYAVGYVENKMAAAEARSTFDRIKKIILARDIRLEPSEMVFYLENLKKLRVNYNVSAGKLSYNDGNFDQDLDALIDASKLSAKKCSTQGFLELQDLIYKYKDFMYENPKYETRRNILHYLEHQKRKLGIICQKDTNLMYNEEKSFLYD